MRRAELLSTLRAMWRHTIHVDDARIVLKSAVDGVVGGQQFDKPIPFQQVQVAVEKLGSDVMDDLITELADALTDDFFKPLLREATRCEWFEGPCLMHRCALTQHTLAYACEWCASPRHAQ